MVTGNRQLFGEDPVQVRESDHYKLEYIQSFVEKWDELIDWKMRAESEGDFFIRQLRERGARKVLDVATGKGFHSVRLLNEGFEVVNLDSLGSPNYYRRTADEVRLREVGFEDHTEHLPTHYARVLQETERV